MTVEDVLPTPTSICTGVPAARVSGVLKKTPLPVVFCPGETPVSVAADLPAVLAVKGTPGGRERPKFI